jgi:hypothetical protein
VALPVVCRHASECVQVNGDNTHPVYRWLKSQKKSLGMERIKWNFEKAGPKGPQSAQQNSHVYVCVQVLLDKYTHAAHRPA